MVCLVIGFIAIAAILIIYTWIAESVANEDREDK
jgi:hypothetical protein